MRRVIVTGATSMIGVATIEECIRNNTHVIAIVREGTTRLDRLPVSTLVNVVYADADDISSVKLCENADVLYHFLWVHTHKEMRDDPIAQVANIKITLDAVKLAFNSGCKKIVFAGSQAEYGPVDELISEETRPNPQTAYGMAKLSAAMMSKKLCEILRIEFIWARIFSVYGRYDNKGTMIDASLNYFLKREKVFFSSGLQVWNYLFERDAGRVFFLLGKESIESGFYNVANKENRILKEYILDMINCFHNADYELSNSTSNSGGIMVDTSKLISQIGDFDTVPFVEGVKEIIRYKTNLVDNYNNKS